MAKNTLSDLNNHLFAQLERLGNEDLSEEELNKEINRSKAINGVAKNLIDNARISLEALRFIHEEVPVNEKQNIPDQFKLKSTNR